MYLEQWKSARKQFEKLTQQKKPSEKFLGVFNKSTGIESAVKGLDASLDNGDEDKMLKAEQVFGEALGKSTPILIKAAKDEAGTYPVEVAKLAKALQDIGVDFGDERKQKNVAASQAIANRLLKAYVDMVKVAEVAKKQAAIAKRQAILDHGACSDAVAAAVLAAVQGDEAAVKAGFAMLGLKAKAIEAAIATHTAAFQKLEAARLKIGVDFRNEKAGLLPVQVKTVQGQSDAAQTAVSTVEELVKIMQDELDETKALIKEAALGTRDATKQTALLVKTIEQLAERASKLATPMVAASQDIDGKLDHQRDRIERELNAEADPGKQVTIAQNIRMKLEATRDDAAAQAKEVGANTKAILEAASRISSAVMNDPQAKAAMDGINRSVTSMEESGAKFDKAVAKAERILASF